MTPTLWSETLKTIARADYRDEQHSNFKAKYIMDLTIKKGRL